jgi:hypothetical protein
MTRTAFYAADPRFFLAIFVAALFVCIFVCASHAAATDSEKSPLASLEKTGANTPVASSAETKETSGNAKLSTLLDKLIADLEGIVKELKQLIEDKKPKKIGKISVDGTANLRGDPSMKGEILGALKYGDSVTVLEKKNGWYKVETSEKTGWISAKSVNVPTDKKSADKKKADKAKNKKKANSSKSSSKNSGEKTTSSGKSGKGSVGSLLEAAAKKYNIPENILKAVAWQESGWNPKASSFDGGHGKGVMQIDDRWHAFARTQAVWDPAKNIEYGAKLLAGLYKSSGSWSGALLHYNGGSSYPPKVLALSKSQPWKK